MSTRAAELQRRIAELSTELLAELAAAEVAATPAPAPPYLSIPDFAARLHVSTRSVRRMIEDGMPIERPRPRIVRIPVAAAERWIAKEAARRAG